jgi:hypothetical protein
LGADHKKDKIKKKKNEEGEEKRGDKNKKKRRGKRVRTSSSGILENFFPSHATP